MHNASTPVINLGTLPHWSDLTPLEKLVYLSSWRATQLRCIGCGVTAIPDGAKPGWSCPNCPDVWEAPDKHVAGENRSDRAAYAARRDTIATVRAGEDRPTFNKFGGLVGIDVSPHLKEPMITDDRGNIMYDPESQIPWYDEYGIVTSAVFVGYVADPSCYLRTPEQCVPVFSPLASHSPEASSRA
jgi:hypothetical protein